MLFHEIQQRVDELLQKKDYEGVHKIIDQEINNKESLKSESFIHDKLLFLKAKTFFQEGQYDQGTEIGLSCLRLREETSEIPDIIETLHLLSDLEVKKYRNQRWTFPTELEETMNIRELFESINSLYLKEIPPNSYLSEAGKYLQQSYNLSSQIKDIDRTIVTVEKLLHVKKLIKSRKDWLSLSKEFLNLSQQIGDEYKIATAQFEVGWATWGYIAESNNSEASYEQAINFFKNSIKLFEKLSCEKEKARVLVSSIFLYRFGLGDNDTGIKNLKKGLEIFDKLNDYDGQSWTLYLLGNTSLALMKLEQAMQYYQQGLEVAQKITDRRSFLSRKNLIVSVQGMVYQLRGQNEQANSCFNKTFDSLLKTEIYPPHEHFIESLLGIAQMQYSNEKILSALIWAKKAIYFGKKLTVNNFSLTNCFSLLINIAIESENDDFANLFCSYFEKIISRDSITKEAKDQKWNFMLTKATLLMKSGRLNDKVEADNLLHQIIEEDQFIRRKVKALFLSAKMRLFEFRTTENKDTLIEFKNLISQLLMIGESENLQSLAIEILIISSQLELAEGNLEQARKFLLKALEKAKKGDFKLLIANVKVELEKLERAFQKWTMLIDKNLTFKERLEKSELTNYINSAIAITKTYDH